MFISHNGAILRSSHRFSVFLRICWEQPLISPVPLLLSHDRLIEFHESMGGLFLLNGAKLTSL